MKATDAPAWIRNHQSANQEREACRRRLEAWATTLRQLLAMYDSTSPYSIVPADRIATARALYVQIKKGLRAESVRMMTRIGEAELSQTELQIYRPTVHTAGSRFVAISTASSGLWHDGVADALLDFERALHTLGQDERNA